MIRISKYLILVGVMYSGSFYGMEARPIALTQCVLKSREYTTCYCEVCQDRRLLAICESVRKTASDVLNQAKRGRKEIGKLSKDSPLYGMGKTLWWKRTLEEDKAREALGAAKRQRCDLERTTKSLEEEISSRYQKPEIYPAAYGQDFVDQGQALEEVVPIPYQDIEKFDIFDVLKSDRASEEEKKQEKGELDFPLDDHKETFLGNNGEDLVFSYEWHFQCDNCLKTFFLEDEFDAHNKELCTKSSEANYEIVNN